MPAAAERLQLALGASGVAACLAAATASVRAVHVEPEQAHRLTVAGLHLSYPALNAAAAALLACAALGAAVLAVAVAALARQAGAQRRLLHQLPHAGRLPQRRDVALFHAREPLAFCAGWLRPRVFLSTGALERLSAAQLHAVLAHEDRHRAARDPLRLALSRALAEALFFLPVLRPLHARRGEQCELAADASAAQAAGAAPLAGALLAFGAGVSPERVDRLLGRPPAWRAPRGLSLAAFATLASLIALVWRASSGATIAATLNLPIASSQPCVLVLALIPLTAALAAAILRHD